MPGYKEMLTLATEILESQERKSKAQFGFVPPIPQHYSFEALRMGYQIEQATGNVILNPFCLEIQSLADTDSDWLTDRAIFYEWLDYAKENAKSGDLIRKMTGQ